MASKSKLFLAHNSNDKPLIRELRELLKSRGIETWMDEYDIRHGSWMQAIEEAIAAPETAVAIIIGQSGLGIWEREELEMAYITSKEKQTPIIPILLHGVDFSALSKWLRTKNQIDFREGFSESELRKLASWLASHEVISADEAETQVEHPLERLYKRATSAHRPLERHRYACFVWEASLKLATALALSEVAALARGGSDPRLEPLHVYISSLQGNLFPSKIESWLGALRTCSGLLSQYDKDTATDIVAFADRVFNRKARQFIKTSRTALSKIVHSPIESLLMALPEHLRKLDSGELNEFEHDSFATDLLEAFDESIRTAPLWQTRPLWRIRDIRTSISENAKIVEVTRLQGENEIARTVNVKDEVVAAQLQTTMDQICFFADESNSGEPFLQPAKLRWLSPFVKFHVETEELAFLEEVQKDQLRYRALISGRTEVVATESAVAWMHGIPNAAINPKSHVQPSTDEPDDQSGKLPRWLGDFQLLEEIGQGANGRVYRAQQQFLGREVAVKQLLRPDDPKMVERFKSELQALARIEHPNVVKVYSYQIDNRYCHYAMELVTGKSLKAEYESASSVGVQDGDTVARANSQSDTHSDTDEPTTKPLVEAKRCDDGKTDSLKRHRADSKYDRRIVRLMHDVCQAVQELHARKIHHRDIKPANIIISEGKSGEIAMLADFGVARLDTQPESIQDSFVGTYRYASSQQITNPHIADDRNDVYSIGATLWELLALHPLFPAGLKEEEIKDKINGGAYQEIRQHRKIPQDLQAIVQKAMDREACNRYGSANDLANDLRSWLECEPVSAYSDGLWYKFKKKFAKHPKTVTGVIVAVMMFFASWAFYTFEIATQRDIARGERNRAKHERDSALEAWKKSLGTVNILLTNVANESQLRSQGFVELRGKLLGNAIDHFNSLEIEKLEPSELTNKIAMTKAEVYYSQAMLEWEKPKRGDYESYLSKAEKAIKVIDSEELRSETNPILATTVLNVVEAILAKAINGEAEEANFSTAELLCGKIPTATEREICRLRIVYLKAFNEFKQGKKSIEALAGLNDFTPAEDTPDLRLLHVTADILALRGYLKSVNERKTIHAETKLNEPPINACAKNASTCIEDLNQAVKLYQLVGILGTPEMLRFANAAEWLADAQARKNLDPIANFRIASELYRQLAGESETATSRQLWMKFASCNYELMRVLEITKPTDKLDINRSYLRALSGCCLAEGDTLDLIAKKESLNALMGLVELGSIIDPKKTQNGSVK